MTENGLRIIEQYLGFVRSKLPEIIADDVIEELRVYLQEAALEIGEGEMTEKSAKKAVARFGAPSEVAREYRESIGCEDTTQLDYIEPKDKDQEMEHEIPLREVTRTIDSVETKYHSYWRLFGKAILFIICFLGITAFPLYFNIYIIGFTLVEMICAVFIITGIFLTALIRNQKLQIESIQNQTRFEKYFSFPTGLFETTAKIIAGDIVFTSIGIFMTIPFLFSQDLYLYGILLIIFFSYRIIFDLSKGRNQISENAKKSTFLDGVILFFIHIGYVPYIPPYSYYSFPMVNTFFPIFGMVYSSFTLVMLIYKMQAIWWRADRSKQVRHDSEKDSFRVDESDSEGLLEVEKHRRQQSPKIEAEYISTFGKSIVWIILLGIYSFLTIYFTFYILGMLERTLGFFFIMTFLHMVLAIIFSSAILIYQLQNNVILWKRSDKSTLKSLALMPKNAFHFDGKLGLSIDVIISFGLAVVAIFYLQTFTSDFSFVIISLLMVSLILKLDRTFSIMKGNEDSLNWRAWSLDAFCYLLVISMLAYMEEAIYGPLVMQYEYFIGDTILWFMLLLVCFAAYLLLKIATTMHFIDDEKDLKEKPQSLTPEQRAELLSESRKRSGAAIKGYSAFILGIEIFRITILLLANQYDDFILYITGSPYFIGSVVFWILGIFLIKLYFRRRTRKIESGKTTQIYGKRSRFESLSDVIITTLFIRSILQFFLGSWIYDIFMIPDVGFDELFLLNISLTLLIIGFVSRFTSDLSGLVKPNNRIEVYLLYVSYIMFFIFGIIMNFLFALNLTPYPMNSFQMFIHTSVIIFSTFQLPIGVLGILTIQKIRNTETDNADTHISTGTPPIEGPIIAASESIR